MQRAMLVTSVGGMACAFPVEHVVEIMRPLPIEPIGRSAAGVPAVVDGLAMIRGAPVPVIDARRLLCMPAERAARFVVVRIADRRLALQVDAVVDVRRIAVEPLSRLPSLLGGADSAAISAIGSLDAALLVVLDAARILPEDSWRAIEQAGEPDAARSEP